MHIFARSRCAHQLYSLFRRRSMAYCRRVLLPLGLICKRPDDEDCHRLLTAESNFGEIKSNDFAMSGRGKKNRSRFLSVLFNFENTCGVTDVFTHGKTQYAHLFSWLMYKIVRIVWKYQVNKLNFSWRSYHTHTK